jgi:Glycosyl transferase family 2/Galactosyltransferase
MAAAAAPDAAARLVVERVEGATVVGWAVAAAGGPALPELWVDGERVPAPVDSIHRQDVLDALRVQTDAKLGFRLHLPPQVWSADGSARSAEIRVGVLSAPAGLPAGVERLVEALRDQPGLGDWERRFVELAAHVQALGPQALAGGAAHGWLQAQVSLRSGRSAAAALDRHPDASLLGHVERLDHAVIHGWACLEGFDNEAVGLHCNGEPVDCMVIRIERVDVQSALQSGRRHFGFEIEIPATVWQAASGAGDVLALSVQVAGRPLGAEPLRLTRDMLVHWLDRQRDADQRISPDETGDERRERQYATLLLIEHAVAAGLWPALGTAQRAFVLAQAERYGVAALLGPVVAGEVDEVVPGDAALHDYATVTVWQLLRQFNALLNADPSQPVQALQAVLRSGQAAGTIGQRFLYSVIPYFCGQGLYHALRPHLDAGRIRALVACESAWELSLVLPEAVASGDLGLAQSAMKKIAAGATGWLNTDCVAAAVQAALIDADAPPGDAAAATAFLDGFLDLLQQMAGIGYWSRLHDARLIQGLVALLAAEGRHDEAFSARAEHLALRCYAAVPDFWQAIDRATGPVGGWSPALQEARACFDALRQLLARPAAAGAPPAADIRRVVGWLQAAGNVDADLFARELAMAWPAASEAGQALQGPPSLLQGRNEALRLAAHPALPTPASLPAGLQAPGPALDDEIRALADVGKVPRRRMVAALVARCLAAGHDRAPLAPDEAGALRSLARRDSHYLGVRLASAHWLRHRNAMPVRQRDAGLIDLREQWVDAFNACIDLPVPPAALMGSYSLLDAASSERGGDGLSRVVAEMRRLLQQRYGETVVLSAGSACTTPALGPGTSGYSTLVAIYSCRRNLAGRVQAIRDTWARDLDALGIPWVVVVGDGEGRLEGDVLGLPVSDAYEGLPAKTLALVEWVYRHTRFEHLLKIDDDCHLAAAAYFAQAPYLAHHYHGRRLHRGIGGTDRVWHQGRSSSERAARSADKSPEPSIYADGGAAYCLSRHAMAQVIQALQTTAGARLTRSAYLEDKLLGDLLATRGIGLSNEGHYTLIRRRFGAAALPVNAYDNLFYPSRQSPTLVTHLDGHADLPSVQAGQGGDRLLPARIWPTAGPVRLGGSGTNQLELLSPADRVLALANAPVVLVAVARNERALVPHFLEYYRGLGLRAFVFVDNLSDDGTREYLAAQPDVVLYSADTEYKHSHYGVSWQQAVLGAHALGKWVLLADLDEFLVYPDCERTPLERWVGSIDAAGHDAARVLMIDMYPEGELDAADFSQQAPFEAAPCFDRDPVLHWALGSGSFSNGPTYLSALRHRLIPDSAPNLYTSQKLAVFRYQPWVRLSEGLHYASNLRPAPEPVWFAHFKYHAGFRRKVRTEVARLQHFNGAEEYKKYAAMLAEARGSLAQPAVSERYAGSRTWQRAR